MLLRRYFHSRCKTLFRKQFGFIRRVETSSSLHVLVEACTLCFSFSYPLIPTHHLIANYSMQKPDKLSQRTSEALQFCMFFMLPTRKALSLSLITGDLLPWIVKTSLHRGLAKVSSSFVWLALSFFRPLIQVAYGLLPKEYRLWRTGPYRSWWYRPRMWANLPSGWSKYDPDPGIPKRWSSPTCCCKLVILIDDCLFINFTRRPRLFLTGILLQLLDLAGTWPQM